MKRIVEETLKSGSKRYRVETNRLFFGLFPCARRTDDAWEEPAVFYSLEDAQRFCGIDPNPVISRHVVSEV